MTQNNRDFTAKECQAVMKYLFLEESSNHDMSVTFSDKHPCHSIVKNWVAGFRTDEDPSGKPTQVTMPENVNAIRSMVLDNRRLSTTKIAETMVISRERERERERERADYIIHKILDMR
jgi:hypothetical protein